jgi:DNA repair protein RecO (recombination protein O)
MIYDVLTDSNGLISIIAKGIKKKKDGYSMQPFKEVQLSFTKAKLPLLTKHEVLNSYSEISKKYMLAGLYFNELIYKFIPKNEPLPFLFQLYKDQLIFMTNSNSHNLYMYLLRFEYLFLKEIGYEINLAYQNNYIINNKTKYYYRFGEGFKELDSDTNPKTIVSGEDLEKLISKKFDEIVDIKNFRFISKEIIKENLGDKNIKSYEMLD